MHWLYVIVRLYPYWALVVSLIFGDLTLIYHRKERSIRYLWIFLSVFFLVTSLTWFHFRGDINSDKWLSSIIEPVGSIRH